MTGEGTTADGPLTLVEVAHLSDTGRVRHHNEDRALASDGILVVADGMGGAKAGEVAAQMAVDAVGALSAPFSTDDVREAVGEANRAIRRMASDEPDKSGMGTTLTAAMMREDHLDVVHVGDSRAYLWRDGALTQITEDHSVVAELVRRGSITAEEAESHPHRNVITRALGADAEVEADTVSAQVRDGDVVLLCSDGLSSYVPESAIAGVLAEATSLGAAARELVNTANRAGGTDNVTVVLARIGPASAPRAGDTMEVPVVAPADGDGDGEATAAGVRVLGGVHGHAGTDRPGAAPAGRAPKVLEPVSRRRSRLVPILIGVLVLIAALVGAVAWGNSRVYTLESSSAGTLRVAHGLPWDVFGRDLATPWQETDVAVDAVRGGEPAALETSFPYLGRGEAVGCGPTRVDLRHRAAPGPGGAGAGARPRPGHPRDRARDARNHRHPVSPRTRELGFMVPALLLGLVGLGSVASARADALDYGPLPGAAGVLVVFLAMHLALRLRAPKADAFVLPVVGVLVAIGLVELYRISPALAADQAVWMAVGGVAFIVTVVALPDHRVLERYTYLIGLTAVGLLVITMVFGTRINGAKLWIQIGGGQTVQLGEVAKVLLVVFLAAYLRDKRELLAIPTGRVLGVPVPPMAALGPVLLFLGACLALVVVLNDFGTALLFLGIFLAMIYLATGRVAYTGFGLGAFVVGSAAVYAVVPRIESRVRNNRLRPFDDAQDQGYQLVQSLYALAEGGIIGPGLGRGFLVTEGGTTVIPALQTDFMFSAVASELGYVGGVGLLLGFLVLIQRGFVIAAQANDGFSKLLAGGLTAALGLQAILIIGGVTRLIPLTGVTLPFLSYGGSSVVTNFVLIALLLIISHRTHAATS